MSAILSRPRWTHIALPSSDIDRSVTWYQRFTPLVVLQEFADTKGRSAWLTHEGPTDSPFVLVLVMFDLDAGHPRPIMAPFAHIGIELPSRGDVEALAEQGRSEGCLAWEPADIPPPVGFVCALTDPDGNVVEMSHNQGVFAAVQDKWGAQEADRR